jgi:hypothetical protein
MESIFLSSCCLLLITAGSVAAQAPTPRLAAFFEQRLNTNAPAPSYEDLLKVIDPIASSDPKEIAAALPSISSALASTKDNLPIEAGFALFEILLRPDGAALLRSRIPEIGSLLARPDERLSGGAILTLRNLTQAAEDTTVPIMIQFLNTPSKPSFTKIETVSTLFAYRSGDTQAVKAIQNFLSGEQEPPVRVAMLEALANNRVNTPTSDTHAIEALHDPNKAVKLAAIRAVGALGPQVWSRAQAAVTRLAVDPAEDKDVRTAADHALRNNPEQ